MHSNPTIIVNNISDEDKAVVDAFIAHMNGIKPEEVHPALDKGFNKFSRQINMLEYLGMFMHQFCTQGIVEPFSDSMGLRYLAGTSMFADVQKVDKLIQFMLDNMDRDVRYLCNDIRYSATLLSVFKEEYEGSDVNLETMEFTPATKYHDRTYLKVNMNTNDTSTFIIEITPTSKGEYTVAVAKGDTKDVFGYRDCRDEHFLFAYEVRLDPDWDKTDEMNDGEMYYHDPVYTVDHNMLMDNYNYICRFGHVLQSCHNIVKNDDYEKVSIDM